jgi:Ser/Thr protein kinase RdoA (MazF antagonist)
MKHRSGREMKKNDSKPLLQPVYSTAHADAVADFVAAQYSIPSPVVCQPMRRGFNDTFEVRAEDGWRAVLRLSARRARGEADLATEVAILAYLSRMGIPVAAPIPAPEGKLHASARLAEGLRPAVLFSFVEGRAPGSNSRPDASAQGVTLARIHAASHGFVNDAPERYRLDLDHLLHRPLATILEVKGLGAAARDEFSALASRLANAVAETEGLGWTRCHGRKARIEVEGPHAGQATFFDFDDGGPGFLACDLAVFLWVRVSFGRAGTHTWHAFIDGCRSVRPISSADFEATHRFVPIRHIWLLGEWAGRAQEWGSEVFPADWLAKELNFLREWEAEKISPRLP